MTGDRAGHDPSGRSRPEWPMAPGVPGSSNAREARTIVGLPPDASDGEFIGASPSEGRDALVSAARRRLEPVLAAHGPNSRESWLVDHELKSALGRLLAALPLRGPTPAPPAANPAAAPAATTASTTAATPAAIPASPPAATPAAPRAATLAAAPDIAVAKALYMRRNPVGRAMLGLSMQLQRTGQPSRAADPSRATHVSQVTGDISTDHADAARAHAHARTRSRARIIAATIAVLSAIGLVIEIAYVPVHLQRARARQQSGADSSASSGAAPAPARAPAPRPVPEPVPQPESGSDAELSRSAPASTGSATRAPSPPSAAERAPASPRQVPIPSPALPADQIADGQPRPAPTEPEPIDPTLRQRLEKLTEQWLARVNSSIDARRSIESIDPGPRRWLAQARLLERLIALDDIAQLLIEARADDAEPLVDVMPVACNLTARPVPAESETSSREDGRLVTDLSRAGGGGESRLAVLRAYRSLPLAPGRVDARALVSEALAGPSRNSRALALAILLERGGASVAVLEAVHARVGDLTATQAGRAVVEQLSGEAPGGASVDVQSLRARIARKILEGRGAPMHAIDATADATVAMLDRMARRADPQVAPADIESSIATLARAASRDAAPARLDGADGPLQRMVASLSALEGARIVRNYRRIPSERARVDAVAAAASARVRSADSSLGQAIEIAIALLAQDCISMRAPDLALPAGDTAMRAGGASEPSNPLLLPAPPSDSIARWPEAARALGAADGDTADGDALIRIAEDVQDSATDAVGRSVAARVYARAALAGSEPTAASAARGIASLVPAGGEAGTAERLRWESIAAQYSMADAAMRGTGRMQRRAGAGIDADTDASSRVALADAIALCMAGYGRQAIDRLQSPTVRALAQRLSGALPGGMSGIEALCEGRTPSSPPLEPRVADQLLAVEAALRDPRSTRWSDDLALRRGLPFVSVDTASRAVRITLFTPAPAPGPQ